MRAGIGLEGRKRNAGETVNEGAREREREVTLSRGAQQGDSRVSGRAPSVSPQVYASRTATGRAGSARRTEDEKREE